MSFQMLVKGYTVLMVKTNGLQFFCLPRRKYLAHVAEGGGISPKVAVDYQAKALY